MYVLYFTYIVLGVRQFCCLAAEIEFLLLALQFDKFSANKPKVTTA